jgi:hypothetical protein
MNLHPEESGNIGENLMCDGRAGRTLRLSRHPRRRHMAPYMMGYIPAVIFFLTIIGGIILLGTRDTEHPQTRPH